MGGGGAEEEESARVPKGALLLGKYTRWLRRRRRRGRRRKRRGKGWSRTNACFPDWREENGCVCLSGGRVAFFFLLFFSDLFARVSGQKIEGGQRSYSQPSISARKKAMLQ